MAIETTFRWAHTPCDPRSAFALSSVLQIHPLTARLLINRNICETDAASRFLNPAWDHLHDPFLLPDMETASRRIADAVQSRETIFVHGDYDVDGVTSTALYVRSLKALGGNVVYRVPHRKNEGYDLKTAGIEWAHEQGAALIITSDCGIQAHKAVALANGLGMTVIITDHHEPGASLPPAYAVVNPHRKDSRYPFPYLAGVGVAYKTMQAVVRLLQPQHEQVFLERFVDLVACGTVADVMPLLDENRVLVKFGLQNLAKTRKVGLRTLLLGSGIDITKPLTADTVGFGIGPRINAVGRMDDAGLALELLLTGDANVAAEIVEQLNAFNLERQIAQKLMLSEALGLLGDRDMVASRVLVLAGHGWNSGVVGIVAGKLVEMFHRPTIVIGIDGDSKSARGSARSIPGYDMFHGIQHCKDLLDSCGGHEMAAGLSLALENLTAFDARINQHARASISDADLIPCLHHDGVVEPCDLSVSLIEEWQDLAPFGQGNPEPKFMSSAMRVRESRRIGKDSTHIKFSVEAGNAEHTDCVAWGRGDWASVLKHGQEIDALYTPQVNEWNNRRTVQFIVKDIRLNSREE